MYYIKIQMPHKRTHNADHLRRSGCAIFVVVAKACDICIYRAANIQEFGIKFVSGIIFAYIFYTLMRSTFAVKIDEMSEEGGSFYTHIYKSRYARSSRRRIFIGRDSCVHMFIFVLEIMPMA